MLQLISQLFCVQHVLPCKADAWCWIDTPLKWTIGASVGCGHFKTDHWLSLLEITFYLYKMLKVLFNKRPNYKDKLKEENPKTRSKRTFFPLHLHCCRTIKISFLLIALSGYYLLRPATQHITSTCYFWLQTRDCLNDSCNRFPVRLRDVYSWKKAVEVYELDLKLL